MHPISKLKFTFPINLDDFNLDWVFLPICGCGQNIKYKYLQILVLRPPNTWWNIV